MSETFSELEKTLLFLETFPKYTLEDMSWVDPDVGSFKSFLNTVRNTLREIELQNDYCNGCGLTDHGCGMTLL